MKRKTIVCIVILAIIMFLTGIVLLYYLFQDHQQVHFPLKEEEVTEISIMYIENGEITGNVYFTKEDSYFSHLIYNFNRYEVVPDFSLDEAREKPILMRVFYVLENGDEIQASFLEDDTILIWRQKEGKEEGVYYLVKDSD